MDANNTRFYLLLGKEDWLGCRADAALSQPLVGVDWDDTRHELTLSQRIFRFPSAPADLPPKLTDRRGADRDQYGNWYWIDQTQTAVLVRSAGSDTVSRFWPVESGYASPSKRGAFGPSTAPMKPAATTLAGLAVTEDHYLVVGTLQPKGVLIFDLHSVGAPHQLLWPEQVDFVPFDMAAMPGGGVWILDRDNRRYWGLDHNFALVADGQTSTTLRPTSNDDFKPVGSDAVRQRPALTFPNGIKGAAGAELDVLNPLAIEALPDGSVLILDTPDVVMHPNAKFSLIHHYRFDQRLHDPLAVDKVCELFEEDEKSKCQLLAYDFAFLPIQATPNAEGTSSSEEPPIGQLVLVAEGGNQCYAFDLHSGKENREELTMKPRKEYLPLRRFGGRGLVADWTEPSNENEERKARAYYDFGVDGDLRWLPVSMQARPRYNTSATLYTPIFDGRDFNCVWHRLILDACLPAGCTVTICSRAANEKADLLTEAIDSGLRWQTEPSLYLRSDGSELPYLRRTASGPNDGSWELLFQRATGRYLQLKLVLTGDERLTPRLRALRLYYPRFAYTTYLPAAYRDRTLLRSLYTAPNTENIETLTQRLADLLARLTPGERTGMQTSWVDCQPPAPARLAGLTSPIFAQFFRRLSNAETDWVRQAAITIGEYLASLTAPSAVLARLALATLDELLLPLIEEQQREIEASYTFLERFLANFEGIFTAIEDRIAAVQLLFDVRSAPIETLDWLAQWFGLLLESGWSEQQRRLMIKHAMEFFQFRGTPFGLKMALRLVWESCPDDAIFKLYPETVGERRRTDAIRISERGAGQPRPPAAGQGQQRWLPEQKGAALNLRYAAALPATTKAEGEIVFPVRRPAGELGDSWADFTLNVLGFVPMAEARHQYVWQHFLQQRYQGIESLIKAYGLRHGNATASSSLPRSFADVTLPASLPADGAALEDWLHFESHVLPQREAAHRFTVQLPIRYSGQRNTTDNQQALELAERVVTLQKPAHTTFDIKFYWAMFRVDEARLGLDTLIGLGSRAPELLPSMVLGEHYLLESTLAATYPQNLWQRSALSLPAQSARQDFVAKHDFIVVGRDRITN